MTTTQHTRSDHQVKEAIEAELDWLPSIQADRIGVAINDGAVTLSGQVQTYPEKRAAVRAAFRVRASSLWPTRSRSTTPGPRAPMRTSREKPAKSWNAL